MIRPTQRAVVLSGIGLGFALTPVFLGSSFWTLYLLFIVAFVSLLGLDAMLGVARSQLSIEVDLPTVLYVGASDPVTITLAGPRPARVRLLLDVDDLLVEPAAHTATIPAAEPGAATAATTSVEIPLVPLRRGTARIPMLWLAWTGPLGLTERLARHPLDRSIPILPNVRAVRSTALELFRQNELMAGLRTERYLGDGSEFDALREFTPGLDHRTIDWKASARHRKLLNRQFRAERNHQVIIALDTGRLMREPIDGVPKLDHAINAGLLLGYVCLRTGDRVGLYGFDAKPGTFAEPMSGVSAIHRLQHLASRLEYSPDETNFTFGLAELSSRVRRRSLIVLMTDFVDTVTAELLLENVSRLTRKHLVVFVCLRDPTLYARHDREPDTILDLNEAVVARDLVRDRNVVIRRLQRMGVHCVDTEPKRFSSALLSTYLRIRQRELVGMNVELRSTQFRREREATWRELEGLVALIDKRGLRALAAKELTRLPGLYRATVSALSVARAISLDRNLIEYLEGLSGRAYFHVYSNRRGFWATAWEFLTETFPRTFRDHRWFVLMAALFLGSGSVTGFVMTVQDLDRFYLFVPPEMAQGRDPTADREQLLEVIYPTTDLTEVLTTFASMLFSNNSRVGMLCFALGIIPAIPVFYLLFFNGLLLGAFAALHGERGLSADLWGWLLPHGVTELLAIVLCGAGGLMLGHALVFPGRRTRRENLGRQGREAAKFVLGAVLMLFIAALIEGFFRQLVHDIRIRYGLALASAAFWIFYFGFLGRTPRTLEAGP